MPIKLCIRGSSSSRAEIAVGCLLVASCFWSGIQGKNCLYPAGFTIQTPASLSAVNPEDATAAASVAPASSSIECAAACTTARDSCQTAVFVASSKSCLMSSLPNFTASSASGQTVLRKTALYGRDASPRYVQLGNRSFIVIQQRTTGLVNFARNWPDYEDGFGDGDDFWIGLKKIHCLTEGQPRNLRVELQQWTGALAYCEYSGFYIDGSAQFYAMHFDSYLPVRSNTTGDSLNYHRGQQFSTIDVDNDGMAGGSCAVRSGGGGWWFSNCVNSNPNGFYYAYSYQDGNRSGVIWYNAASNYKSLRMSRLLLEV